MSAKSDAPLDAITLRACWREANKPAWAGDVSIVGFDTETADGRVFLISTSSASRTWHIGNGKTALTPDEIFRALTNREGRSAINVWYNLDFDANVILSALPFDRVAEVKVMGATEWEGYSISYVPSKFLLIKDRHRNQYKHYDISQFFYGKLSRAVKEWEVGSDKLDTIDVQKFGLNEAGELNDYIRSEWDRIVDYAERDADLARKLWRRFCDVAEPLNIPCGRPYSTGYLAEQTFNVRFRNGERKPRFGDFGMQRRFWESYHGGRFEVLKRGDVGDVILVDINSAYPNVLRSLPDPTSLHWSYLRGPVDVRLLRAADYGVIRARIWTDSARPLQPFACKIGGRLVYPIMDGQEISVILPAFLYALESGLITDYQVVDSYLAVKTTDTVFPFQFITAMYHERQRYKEAGEHLKQKVLKYILNSMYGKLAQTTAQVFEPGDGPAKPRRVPVFVDMLPRAVRPVFEGRELVCELRAGSYTNPMLASYVTGLVRLQLLRAAVDSGLENSVCLMATDSLLVERAAFKASDFEARECAVGLGSWAVEAEGRALVVGAGVYEITGADGEPVKRATRGFDPSAGVMVGLGDLSLWNAARDATGGGLKVTHVRPLKIGEAVHRGLGLGNVGTFLPFEREISAGMDRKRKWPKSDPQYSDLLAGVETGAPLRLAEIIAA